MNSDTSSKRLLSSAASKKAPKEKPPTQPVVGDTMGLLQPEIDLVGPSAGYNITYYNLITNLTKLYCTAEETIKRVISVIKL